MSDYNDFWFVEHRIPNKNLKRWFLILVLLFLFVSVATYFAVKSMYQPITNYEIKAELPIVTVSEANATNVNGVISGTVKNQTDEEIKGKYIQFTFYSKNDVELGKEYIEIGNLNAEETKTYELKFRYTNVERFIVNISNNK